MGKKFAPWYTIERWRKATAEDAALYEEHFSRRPHMMIYKSENGTLYSKGHYPTKIKEDELPPSFIHARIGKLFGYYNAAAVIGVVYKPNLWINHLFRDDLLFISFHTKEVDPNDYGSIDIILSGPNIITAIAAIEVFSDISGDRIAELQNEVAEKVRVYNKSHPTEHDCIPEKDYWEILNRKRHEMLLRQQAEPEK